MIRQITCIVLFLVDNNQLSLSQYIVGKSGKEFITLVGLYCIGKCQFFIEMQNNIISQVLEKIETRWMLSHKLETQWG